MDFRPGPVHGTDGKCNRFAPLLGEKLREIKEKLKKSECFTEVFSEDDVAHDMTHQTDYILAM